MGDIPTMRIVTLGKTGSGKSSLVNTLCGEKKFLVNHFANSQTQHCQSVIRTIHGTNVHLVDTPGFFDTVRNNTELKDELTKCIVECAPGPHAFLLALKVEKFTEQEQEVVKQMMELFSEEALRFTTVVFTHGDQLPDGMEIKEWVTVNEALNDLVQKCGGRCHVIDNRYWNNSQDQYRNNQNQIKQLLQTINQTVIENEGGCYTNEMLLKVQEMKEQEKDRRKRSSPDISEEELDKQVNESVFNKLKRNWIGVTFGALVGALLGVLGVGPLAAGAPVLGICAAAGLGGAVGAALGGLAGGAVSEYYQTVLKAMKNNAKILLHHLTYLLESRAEKAKLVKSN